MNIHFSADDMAERIYTYDQWWHGTLNRPLTAVKRTNYYKSKGCAQFIPNQSNCHDFSVSPDVIIKSWDSYMSDEKYEGDSYPFISFAFFGPGILTAMCGGRADNTSGAMWFCPGDKTELKDIHPRYSPDNKWARRIKDLYYAGLEYWKGSVIMGMPDLGGVMDVAAALRGTENLLTDLYDAPEEVLRLISETETAWHEAYNDFASVLAPQRAFTDWSGILSGEKSYIIQSDFCYMISNPMFRTFVLPTLKRDSEKLVNTIYHLDGKGELKHLDDILGIKNIKSVQWVPGAEQPPAPEWLEVYKKITSAGKSYWLVGSCDDYFNVLEKVHGTPFFSCTVSADNNALAEKIIKTR